MDRQSISPEQQGLIDAFKSEQGSTFDAEPAEGSNLIEGDDIEVDNQYKMRVIAGQWGCVACLIPEWGDAILPIGLVYSRESTLITDRAGPNGEGMPIFDPPDEETDDPSDEGGEGGAP
jgi:hypothetical protein